MKILFMTLSLSRKAGGLFFSVRSLAQHLARTGAECRALGPRDEFTDQDHAQWNPVPTNSYDVVGPKTIGYSASIKSFIGTPDIQHMHGIWMYHSHVNRTSARQRNVPYLISPRGMLDRWALENSSWKKKISARLYEQKHLQDASCIHALCESEANSIREFGLKNPICVIPNGVSLPELKTRNGLVIAPGDKDKRLLFLGRIHPKKGLRELLDAFARVAVARRHSWRIIVAGWDQNHQRELQAYARQLGIEDKVDFVGPKFGDEKSKLIHECDAFVLPSFSEGLPMSVLEAWAHAKPALITRDCNLPEGAQAGAAIECSVGADGISSGLNELFAMDSSQLNSMGAKGRELVAENFNWPTIARDMVNVYSWLLGRSAPPACVRFD